MENLQSRVGKRKDITPVQSEPKKNPTTTNSTSMISSITSSLASMMPSGRGRQQSECSVSSFNSEASSKVVNERGGPIGANDLNGIKFGKMRNVIEVDVLLLDGEDFKTNISEIEAFKYICRKSLKIPRDDIFGIQMSWRGHPLIQIKLNTKIDIDTLPANFSYDKEIKNSKGETTTQQIVCAVRGVRSHEFFNREPRERPVEDPNGPLTRWIKLEGVGFDFAQENLEQWLRKFGTLLSEFERDILKFHDDVFESDEDSSHPKEKVLVTGKLSIKMEINEPIPQFLPASGQRIKVYYRGIEKLCQNCYSGGHIKSTCTNKRVSWIEYVDIFKVAYPNIEPQLYGRWNGTLAAWKATQKPKI